MVAQTVKNLPAVQETRVQSLGEEDPLEKEMVTHPITLAWRIPFIKYEYLNGAKSWGFTGGLEPSSTSRISIGCMGKGCLPPSLTFLLPQCWGSPTAEQGILPGCTWDMWVLRSGKRFGIFQSDSLQIFSRHYLEEQLSTRKGKKRKVRLPIQCCFCTLRDISTLSTLRTEQDGATANIYILSGL